MWVFLLQFEVICFAEDFQPYLNQGLNQVNFKIAIKNDVNFLTIVSMYLLLGLKVLSDETIS